MRAVTATRARLSLFTPCTLTGPKNATQVWIRTKMVVLFTRECIVLPKCNELYVSLLYFGAFVQAQVKAFALHTSGNSARYFHQPVTSYHSFVLTRSRFYTFVQTKNKEHEAICNSNRRIYEYRIIPHWHVKMSKVKTNTFVFSSRFFNFHIENILILI